jgi:hypothetical protein
MSEVGLVPFVRVALEAGREVMPAYSHRFWPRRFTQPQWLGILRLRRDERWNSQRCLITARSFALCSAWRKP